MALGKWLSLMGLLALLAACSASPRLALPNPEGPFDTQAERCGIFDTLETQYSGKRMFVNNNIWGQQEGRAPNEQCVTENSWTWDWPDSTRISSFPHIAYGGRPYNWLAPYDGFPKVFNDIPEFTLEYDLTQTFETRTFGSTIVEMWLTNNQYDVSHELLFFLDCSGQGVGGSPTGDTVTVGDTTYYLWFSANWPTNQPNATDRWKYVGLVPEDRVVFQEDGSIRRSCRSRGPSEIRLTGTLDLKQLISDLSEIEIDGEPVIDGSRNVPGIELGSELGSGKGSVVINSYSVDIGGDPPAPPPTPDPDPDPTPDPDPDPDPTPDPPAPGPGAQCRVSYDVQNDWGSGAVVNVTVENTGSSPLSGWALEWTFPNAQNITNAWNTDLDQDGRAVRAGNASWNGSVAPQSSTSFGFQLSYSGSNTAPESFTLNGVACQ